MAHHPPPIPSRGALRALRRLAGTSPTVVIGALGSICGVASLNYETRRRVHLAEQVVETKRILHAVSGGRGAAHVSDLFDAAERGEDFTLQTRSRKRRRQTGSRPMATAALVPPLAHGGDIGAAIAHNSDGLAPTPSVDGDRSPRPPYDGLHTAVVDKIWTATRRRHKPPHDLVYARPTSQIKSPDIEDRSDAPTAQSEASSRFEPFGRPGDRPASDGSAHPLHDRRGSNVVTLNTGVDPSPGLQRLFRTGRATTAAAAAGQPFAALTSDHAPTRKPSHPRIGILYELWAKPPERPGLSPVDGMREFWWLRHAEKQAVAALDLAAAGPDKRPSDHIPPSVVSCDQDPAVEQALDVHHQTIHGQPHILSKSDVARAVLHIDHLPPKVTARLADVVDLDRLAVFTDFIHGRNVAESTADIFRRWTAVMRSLTTRTTALDWDMAEAIFHRFRFAFSAHQLMTPPVFYLIRHRLAEDHDRDRAHELLFPSLSPYLHNVGGARRAHRPVFELPTHYVAAFCQQPEDRATSDSAPGTSSDCVVELNKIIEMAQSAGLDLDPSLDPSLVRPVLGRLVRSHDADRAWTLVESLQPVFPKKSAAFLWADLALFHACHGQWGEVSAALDECQARGLPRLAPVAYADAVQRILLAYRDTHDALQTFGFIVNRFKYHGLLPTGGISQLVVDTCVREGRHDLINEWMRLVKKAFPRINAGFRSSLASWHLARTLREIAATPRQMVETCRAIAHGYTTDQFATIFRPLVAELVRLDLSRRISAFPVDRAVIATGDPAQMDGSQVRQAARHLVDAATDQNLNGPDVVDAASDEGRHAAQREMADQLAAVDDLDLLFGGRFDLVKGLSRPSYCKRDVEASRPVMGPRQRRRLAAKVTVQHLWGISCPITSGQVTARLLELISSSALDHALIACTVERMAVDNPYDALQLLETVYDHVRGRHDDAAHFDNDLFLLWLRLADTVGSMKSLIRTLWAIIDTCRVLDWSLEFRVLPALVTQIPSSDRDGRVDADADVVQEIKYLCKRIGLIYTFSPNYVGAVTKFPTWSPWEVN